MKKKTAHPTYDTVNTVNKSDRICAVPGSRRPTMAGPIFPPGPIKPCNITQ